MRPTTSSAVGIGVGAGAVGARTRTASTMDVAHALAADGAPAGLLVVADRQHQGRGRGGNRWESRDGAGLWMTLIERPVDQRVIGVLALRLGLAIADALDPLVEDRIQLKWPNDVMTGRGKVAGILVEARWRNASVDWVAVGIGINRRVPPEIKSAAAVREGVSRARLLEAVVPRLRAAVSVQGQLSDTSSRLACARLRAWSPYCCAARRPGCRHRGGWGPVGGRCHRRCRRGRARRLPWCLTTRPDP
ncbi:MAG: biotin--[acetyl-CoA-carboxylase] ligase [Gemmatimonadaceae bacterium]|nr:biotin--[acetyl-CoA-carboxylase] ligase [Gemmatimonadaceae bacterium]